MVSATLGKEGSKSLASFYTVKAVDTQDKQGEVLAPVQTRLEVLFLLFVLVMGKNSCRILTMG